jgi:hypothetical protein
MATTVKHAARRWAVHGIRYKGSPSEIWWVGTGFIGDEEACGLYTKSNAKKILDWLCSNEGLTSRLSDYAYDIKLMR